MDEVFPLTFEKLKKSLGAEAHSLLADLQSLSVYQVPMFLKSKSFNNEICELAYYESLKSSVQNQDQGERKASPAGYALSSSLQWIQISAAAKALKKKPGVYALWKKENEVQEIILTKIQAELLDKLLDDLIPSFSLEDKRELKKMQRLGMIASLDKEILS